MVLDTLVNNLSSMYSPLDSHLGYLEPGGNGGDALGAIIYLAATVVVPAVAFYITSYAGRTKPEKKAEPTQDYK